MPYAARQSHRRSAEISPYRILNELVHGNYHEFLEPRSCPFDRYDTTVWLLMTTAARDVQLQSPKLPASIPEFTHKADELAVS